MILTLMGYSAGSERRSSFHRSTQEVENMEAETTMFLGQFNLWFTIHDHADNRDVLDDKRSNK